MTVEPSVTVWSGPAFAVGGVGCVCEIGTQTPFCSMEFTPQTPFVVEVVPVGTHWPVCELNVRPGLHGSAVPPTVFGATGGCASWLCANRPHIPACGPVATPALTALQNIEVIGPIVCAFANAAIVGINPALITTIAAILICGVSNNITFSRD
jgi:hypothetical protein